MPSKDKEPKADIVPIRRQSRPVRGKQAGKAIRAQENEKIAYELRRAGVSYPEIAQQIGCSLSTAHGYVMAVLERSASVTKEEAEAVRAMEVERMDRMLQGVWTRAAAGNDRAIDTVLKLMERRSKLLGIDAPRRQEVSGPGGGPIEVSLDARAALAARLGIVLEEDE